MKKILKITILLVTVLWLFGIWYIYFYGKTTLSIQTEKGEISYHVEQALTPEKQRQGLMYRKTLAPRTGMIFLFKPIREARMWMKNTLIPLDMVFFDLSGQVVKVHSHAIPQDETVIFSGGPVAGVLEINAGEAQKYGIRPGSQLDLNVF